MPKKTRRNQPNSKPESEKELLPNISKSALHFNRLNARKRENEGRFMGSESFRKEHYSNIASMVKFHSNNMARQELISSIKKTLNPEHLDVLYLTLKRQRSNEPTTLDDLHAAMISLAKNNMPHSYWQKIEQTGGNLPVSEKEADISLRERFGTPEPHINFVDPQEERAGKTGIFRSIGKFFSSKTIDEKRAARRSRRNSSVPHYSGIQIRDEQVRLYGPLYFEEFVKNIVKLGVLKPLKKVGAGYKPMENEEFPTHDTLYRIPYNKIPAIEEVLKDHAKQRGYTL